MEKWLEETKERAKIEAERLKERAKTEAECFVEDMKHIAENENLDPVWFIEEVVKNINNLKVE